MNSTVGKGYAAESELSAQELYCAPFSTDQSAVQSRFLSEGAVATDRKEIKDKGFKKQGGNIAQQSANARSVLIK